MRVLIVDDEEPIAKMYSESLKAAGIEPLVAGNGEEALKIAPTEQPDVILLDIIMPKLNGLDALAILKRKDETKKIPVIILTNLPAECSEEKAKALGADGYLVKAETEPDEIIAAIKNLVTK